MADNENYRIKVAPAEINPEVKVVQSPQTLLTEKFDSYWRALKGSNPFPARALINPGAIPTPLGQIVLIQVDRSGEELDFYHSIHGTTIAKLIGQDVQGKLLSEAIISEDARRAWFLIYSSVVDSGAPFHIISPFPRYTRLKGFSTCSIYPLGEGELVTHAIAVVDTMPGTEPFELLVGKLVQRLG